MSFMSELDISERALGALIGPGFWIEGDTIGVIDNRNRMRVDEQLHVAARQLGINGYTVTYRRFEGLVFLLRVWGHSPWMVGF